MIDIWKWFPRRFRSRFEKITQSKPGTTLRRFRHLSPQERKLHIGCGGHYLKGWVNVDISQATGADLIWDVTTGLPFARESVSLIHTEDFIEHLSLEGGKTVLKECFRVLIPGGFMRLLTPDLAMLVQCYLERDANALKWYKDKLGARTYAEMFNMGMRMGGHTFLYDEDILDILLTEAGFEALPATFNRSAHAGLCNLDIRSDGMRIYRDCRKPD
jgi:predicted SAM-dependent methyltransferase